MKKVLIVAHVSDFLPKFELNNVRSLQEMGYEVHYASNFNNVNYEMDRSDMEDRGIVCHHVDFVRSPYCFRKHKEVCRQLKELMDKEGFALLHCHTPVGAALARHVAGRYRKSGLKIIYTAHGFHFYKGAPLKYWLIFYPIERMLAKKTDVLITINTEDFMRAKRFCRHMKTRVEHLPGVGRDIDYWSGKGLETGVKEQIRKEIRKELRVSDSEQMLLSVGELIPRKNHEAVIRALKEEEKLQHADYKYFICGQGVLQEYLQQLIDKLGLADKVILLGYRKDIRKMLYGADLFVFPSKQEGLPIALLEALAAGVKVRASDIRGNRDLIGLSMEELKEYDCKNVMKKMEEIYRSCQR